jgi:glutathione S-transferase
MPRDKLVIGTRRYSSWSMRGWLAVKLAGLDVPVELVPLEGGNTIALKTATPTGMVPYLEHGGVKVWESLAICEYCAEIEPSLWRNARRLPRHAPGHADEPRARLRRPGP